MAAVIILNIFSHTSLFIIEHMFDTTTQHAYRTTAGTYFSDKELSPGDFILGNFDRSMTKYGLNLYSRKNNTVLKVPVVSNILAIRKNISEKLHFASGLKITLTNALIMGDKSYLKDFITDKFTVSGMNHLLAISGLHVGIVVGILLWITSFLHMKLRCLIAMPILALLIIFTGFKITVIRAVTFAFVLMTAYILDIKTHLNKMVLFVAAFFMLIDSNLIKDISFLLSFSAVYGIIYFLERKQTFQERTITERITAPVKVGIAATVFTAPFILYYFGNFNYLSILNTVIMLPFISGLIILGILYLIFPAALITPISVFENISLKILDCLYQWTLPSFVLNKISLSLFILTLIFMLIVIALRKKFLLLLVLIVPLLNGSNAEGLYIPKMVRSKSFINISGDKSEIFFKGWYSDFKYKFIPFAAKLSLQEFDKGYINIYDGENKFIKIKKISKNYSNICINEERSNCFYVFKTRSNTIKKNSYSPNHFYLIYKNRFSADNVLKLSDYEKDVYITGKSVKIIN